MSRDSDDSQPDELQRLVRQRMDELGDSVRAAAARSHGLISHATLARIAAGSYRGKRIKADTLAGLALALGIPERKVYAAAEASLRPARWVKVSEEFARLDPEGQARALKMMEEIVADHMRREEEKIKKERPFG